MICVPCRQAGKLLAERKAEEKDLKAEGDWVTHLHTRCLWPKTCTCQHHVTAEAINADRLQP